MYTTVVRWETEGGVGIYMTVNPEQWDADGNPLSHRPVPYSDDGLSDAWQRLAKDGSRQNYFFAFESHEQAIRWFDRKDEYEYFAKSGIGIGVYEVHTTDVVVGHHQVVFKKPNARRLSWVPLAQQVGQIAA